MIANLGRACGVSDIYRVLEKLRSPTVSTLIQLLLDDQEPNDL